MRKKIFFTLTIIWMIIIFVFSARDGDESSNDSYEVGTVIGEVFVEDFNEYTVEQKQEFVESITFYVRKGAHASEYALLAVLLFGALYDKRRRLIYSFLMAWVGAAMYAMTDELHQLFIPDREGRAIDVCIDSSGALFGLVLLFVLIKVFILIKSKIEKKKAQSADYC